MPAPTLAAAPSFRVTAIDALRGLVLFLMLAEVMALPRVAKEMIQQEGLSEWQVSAWINIKHHTDHVEWAGCSLHDLIQPTFSFLVGTAMAFSIAARRFRGDSKTRMWLHAAFRAAMLVWLGIFLRSIGENQTNWIFTDTLSQIGLGYLFLFGLGLVSSRWAWIALVVILAGYWGARALYPLPPEDYDFKKFGVPPNWPHHYEGFMAHWNKNSNLAHAFDQWFLNLFPRGREYISRGGYCTLNFIPTLGTMILGLIAGRWIQSVKWRALSASISMDRNAPASDESQGGNAKQPVKPYEVQDAWSLRAAAGEQAAASSRPELPPAPTPSHEQYWPNSTRPVVPPKPSKIQFAHQALLLLILAGVTCLSLGWGLEKLGICPVVKRIWTPAWTLYSGGWCFLLLAGFYLLLDALPAFISGSDWPKKISYALAFPLIVLGANSIAAYAMGHTIENFIADSFKVHFGEDVFKLSGEIYEPMVRGMFVLATYWLILSWMYRQKIFVRI